MEKKTFSFQFKPLKGFYFGIFVKVLSITGGSSVTIWIIGYFEKRREEKRRVNKTITITFDES